MPWSMVIGPHGDGMGRSYMYMRCSGRSQLWPHHPAEAMAYTRAIPHTCMCVCRPAPRTLRLTLTAVILPAHARRSRGAVTALRPTGSCWRFTSSSCCAVVRRCDGVTGACVDRGHAHLVTCDEDIAVCVAVVRGRSDVERVPRTGRVERCSSSAAARLVGVEGVDSSTQGDECVAAAGDGGRRGSGCPISRSPGGLRGPLGSPRAGCVRGGAGGGAAAAAAAAQQRVACSAALRLGHQAARVGASQQEAPPLFRITCSHSTARRGCRSYVARGVVPFGASCNTHAFSPPSSSISFSAVAYPVLVFH